MATGNFRTTESTIESAVKSDGTLNPDNIRGFMTMKEIAETFSIDINALYKKLNISIEEIPETTTMKNVVSITREKGNLILEDQIRNAVKELFIPKNENKETIKKTIDADPENIKGYNTFKEISETYGVPIEKIMEKLKLPNDKVKPETTGKELRTILEKEGRSFEVEEIREAVKELIAKE